jgi:hypothetical protein
MWKDKIIQFLIFVVLACVLAIPCQAGMVIRKVSSSLVTPDFILEATGNANNWATTNTVSITPSSPDSNSMILAFVICHDSGSSGMTITGCTYDGNAMTEIASVDNGSNRYAKMYRYNGSLGSGAKNIVASFTQYGSSTVEAIQVDGVNSSNPVNVYDTTYEAAVGSGDQQIEVNNTTTENNCLIVCGVYTGNYSATHSVCNTTGQTLLTEVEELNSSVTQMSYKDHDTAGVITQCFESDTYADQLAILVAIQPDGT